MFKVAVVFFCFFYSFSENQQNKTSSCALETFQFCFLTFSSLNRLNAQPLENKNNMAPWHAAPNEPSLLLITFLYLKTAKNTY